MNDTPIRDTIRQVILPLVQAIYDEDPSDILTFCSKHFENLLRKRERETGVQVQGSPPPTGGGSSSSDVPTKGRSTQNPDMTTGIGEQPDLKAPSDDNLEIDGKSGDAKETVGEEVKSSNKILSFGFLPLLNEAESSQPDESLQKKYSETLQNVAQKFDSAEDNLNAELQNAKEISDIVQGRCQNEEEEVSTTTRDMSKEEDGGRRHPNDSRLVVDESWRQRWYDVHPRLERLIRTKRIFTGDRRNLSGDVPPPWFEDSTRNKDGEDTRRCSPPREDGATEEEILADSAGQDPNKEEDLRKGKDSEVEPGLNSACGDFTHRPMQAITAEYVEGVVERLVQRQSVSDAYEGLHFSSYSESESSNVESDNGME